MRFMEDSPKIEVLPLARIICIAAHSLVDPALALLSIIICTFVTSARVGTEKLHPSFPEAPRGGAGSPRRVSPGSVPTYTPGGSRARLAPRLVFETAISFVAIADEPSSEIAAAGHDRCIIAIRPENLDA